MDKLNLSKKSQERYDKIIKVALENFLEKGYENTNLNDIVKKAGGSLSTIYEHFGNKEELFKTIVLDGIKQVYDKIEFQLKDKFHYELEDFLYNFGLTYGAIHRNKDAAKFTRILYSDGYKEDAKLAKFFMNHIRSTIYKVLLDFLQQERIKKQLKSDNPELLVFQFCLLVREPEFSDEILLGKEANFTQEDLKFKIKNIVDFFLNGHKKTH